MLMNKHVKYQEKACIPVFKEKQRNKKEIAGQYSFHDESLEPLFIHDTQYEK